MNTVPVVDISKPDQTSLDALNAACRDHGFFLLAGHGLDALIEQTWTTTKAFFDADRSIRVDIMRSEQNPLGYFDRELTKRRRDHKEVFDFIDPRNPDLDAINRWPAEPADFREVMVEFFDAFSSLATATLTLVHDALDLSAEGRSIAQIAPSSSTARLNHYTVGDPVPAGERDGLAALGDTALGFHTDPGVLTLLLQDNTGGLQTQSRSGEWVDVPPTAGTVVVNLGDCMQAWTNGRYRAAIHRVVSMTTSRRFSIPLFANPARTAVIEPLTELTGGIARYRPFTWREFSAARAYDNFTDLGTPDTQVTDYLID
jgi:isopenicillin N synthase-like dioxygenase